MAKKSTPVGLVDAVVVIVVDAAIIVVLWSLCIVLAVYFILLPGGSYFELPLKYFLGCTAAHLIQILLS